MTTKKPAKPAKKTAGVEAPKETAISAKTAIPSWLQNIAALPTKDIDAAAAKDEDLGDLLRNQFAMGAQILSLTYWRIGKILCYVRDNHARHGEFTKRIETVSEIVGKKPRSLWDAVKFADRVPRAEDALNICIDWAAIRPMLRLPEDEMQTLLADPEVKELGVREVEERVRDIMKERTGGSGGGSGGGDSEPETGATEKSKSKKSAVEIKMDPIKWFNAVKSAATTAVNRCAAITEVLSSFHVEINNYFIDLTGVSEIACNQSYPQEWFNDTADLALDTWLQLQSLLVIAKANGQTELVQVINSFCAKLEDDFEDVGDKRKEMERVETQVQPKKSGEKAK